MQTTSVREIVQIRERGQMTLPFSVREKIDWLGPRSVVEIEAKQEKVVLRPFVPARKVKKQSLEVSWDILQRKLAEIQSAGNKTVDLSEFVITDRRKH